MSFLDEQLKQIDDYLDGKLSPDELLLFEKELEQNVELKTYVSWSQSMRLQYSDTDWEHIDKKDSITLRELEKIANSKDINDLKETISNIDTSNFSKEKQNSWIPKLAIAASILLFIGLFFLNNKTSLKELYVENKDWTELPSLVSRGVPSNQLLEKGEQEFVNNNFTASRDLFLSYLETYEGLNSNVLLYLGISELELDDYEKALLTFDKLIESDAIDKSKGYWYKALVYLKKEDKENAIFMLNTIVSNTENYNFNKATILLNKIK